MKRYLCSFCHRGLLGGALTVDSEAVTYRTGKVTLEAKYRNLRLEKDQIRSIRWREGFLPIAEFRMMDGSRYSFLIFRRRSFEKELCPLFSADY